MSLFPQTPSTLLTRLSAQLTGRSESDWARFFELYHPVMVAFVRGRMPTTGAFDAEDVVQDVLSKLVEVLRKGGYERERGHFHSFLAVMLRNALFSRFRYEQARPEGRATSFEMLPADDPNLGLPPEVFARLEADWARARHRVALDHLISETALNTQTKAVFRDLEETGDSCEVVARRHHLSEANVRQIKIRLSRMLAALEARMR